MNNWSFSGNLGRDAEQRHTASGDSVVSFSVGVKSGFGDKATTAWANCQLWGKRGESVLPYLTKGQLVGICGEVSLREWQDKEGQKRTNLDVRVNDLTLLGKKDGNSQQTQQQQRQAPASQPSGGSFDDLANDIPF
jgi:single-strand DNA-binding protein